MDKGVVSRMLVFPKKRGNRKDINKDYNKERSRVLGYYSMIYQLKKGSYFHVPEWESYDVLRVVSIDYNKKEISYYWIGASRREVKKKKLGTEMILLLQI